MRPNCNQPMFNCICPLMICASVGQNTPGHPFPFLYRGIIVGPLCFCKMDIILPYVIFATWQGFRLFSRLVGRSDTWSKKWWVIFWNDEPKHIKLNTVVIWVVYFTYTLTQTLLYTHMYSLLLFMQSFQPSLSYHLLLLRSLFCLFWVAA